MMNDDDDGVGAESDDAECYVENAARPLAV